MEIVSSDNPRAVYYDRNPANSILPYSSNLVGPHAETTRATYTVPAGNSAFIEMTALVLEIITAAGTPQRREAMVGITPDGGSWDAIAFAAITAKDNTIGDIVSTNTSSHILLVAGEDVQLRTVDGSTTGTVRYRLRAKIVEFDA